jgi:hypothetical protein
MESDTKDGPGLGTRLRNMFPWPETDVDNCTDTRRIIESGWSPKMTAKKMYIQQFRRRADGCRFRPVCDAYQIQCVMESCPIERHIGGV